MESNREPIADLAALIQVQSGGSFDVDYSVVGPNEKVILDGTKERQGDFVFTGNEPGEYRFCFNNEMSTFAEKTVDFEIAVCLVLHLPPHIQDPSPPAPLICAGSANLSDTCRAHVSRILLICFDLLG